MENIKESFRRVKDDINLLKKEFDSLRLNLSETKEIIVEICGIIKKIDNKTQKNQILAIENDPIHKQEIPTIQQKTPTHDSVFKPSNNQNLPISIGNGGVPTDKQTNRQTDKQTIIYNKNQEESFKDAFDLIDSLDNIKKEIRLKFKRLTNQEFLVFSTLYQLDEEFGHSDYKMISQKLNLSESSIRDYIGRLIKKSVPIEKNKLNNKNINLFISKNFKKIASLQTILQLREI